jgi:hypothetical protein
MRDRIGLSSFQLVKTKEARRLELQAENPDMAPIKMLRLLSGKSYSVSLTCDHCGAECMEQHLEIKSAWLTAAGEESIADLCEACVQSKF